MKVQQARFAQPAQKRGFDVTAEHPFGAIGASHLFSQIGCGLSPLTRATRHWQLGSCFGIGHSHATVVLESQPIMYKVQGSRPQLAGLKKRAMGQK
jgi:hypothetical protein